MDTKTEGLTWDIVERTLQQAKEARMHILDVMVQTISQSRAELSPLAPQINTLRINPEKIGDLIGPGGKHIKKIIDETGVDIDVEQDGRVMITSNNADAMKEAEKRVDALTRTVEAGEIYDGKVVRLEDFGAFVEILPNKDGMVHVSQISWERVEKPRDVLAIGDRVKVKVREIDQMGRVNLTMKELLEKPEGYVESTEQRPRSPRPRDRRDDTRRDGRRPPQRGYQGNPRRDNRDR